MGYRAYPKLKHVPAKLLAIRRHLNLSQPKFGKLLDVSYKRLSEFERGRRQPSVRVLLAYARAVNIPLEDLVDDAVVNLWESEDEQSSALR